MSAYSDGRRQERAAIVSWLRDNFPGNWDRENLARQVERREHISLQDSQTPAPASVQLSAVERALRAIARAHSTHAVSIAFCSNSYNASNSIELRDHETNAIADGDSLEAAIRTALERAEKQTAAECERAVRSHAGERLHLEELRALLAAQASE